jgi:hypothetical protein
MLYLASVRRPELFSQLIVFDPPMFHPAKRFIFDTLGKIDLMKRAHPLVSASAIQTGAAQLASDVSSAARYGAHTAKRLSSLRARRPWPTSAAERPSPGSTHAALMPSPPRA